jgi:hypothetical protein
VRWKNRRHGSPTRKVGYEAGGLVEKAGISTGRLFQKQLDPLRLFKMSGHVMTLLEQVQARTEHIEDDVEV